MASRYDIDFSLWPERARPRRSTWRKWAAFAVAVGVGLPAAAVMVLSEITLSPTAPAASTARIAAPAVNAARATAPVRAFPAQASAATVEPAPVPKIPSSALPLIGRPGADVAPPETVGRAPIQPAPSPPAVQSPALAETSVAELHRQATAKASEAMHPNKSGPQAEGDPTAAEKKAAQLRKRQAAEAKRRKQEMTESAVYQLPDGRRVVIQERWGDRRSYASGDFYGGYRPVPPGYVGRPFGRPY